MRITFESSKLDKIVLRRDREMWWDGFWCCFLIMVSIAVAVLLAWHGVMR
jgi:hypothetical protein